MTATDSICIALELERQYHSAAPKTATSAIVATSQYLRPEGSTRAGDAATDVDEDETAVAAVGAATPEEDEPRTGTVPDGCGWALDALTVLLPESISRFRRF